LLDAVKYRFALFVPKRDGVCNPVPHVFTMTKPSGFTYPTQNFSNGAVAEVSPMQSFLSWRIGNGIIKRLRRGYKPRPRGGFLSWHIGNGSIKRLRRGCKPVPRGVKLLASIWH